MELNTTTEILDLATARERLTQIRPLVARMAELMTRVEAAATDAVRDPLHAEILNLVRRINALGAVVKDPAEGLLDFFAWRESEIVHLCWRRDEPDITHWHPLDAGFAGRRPLDDRVV